MEQLEHNRKACATLAGLISGGRLPHTLLLEGPSGCGKKTFARMIAQAALCEGAEKPCGVCAHCIKIERGVHPDVILYTLPEGKKEFPVDLVRALRQDAYIAPNEAEGKVYLLDCAHTMNTAAQNALLKIVEEPPAGARFIFLCENRALMLPTILSRAVCIELEMPSVEQCARTLARLAPDREEGERLAAAQGADGNIGQALGLLGSAKPSRAAADARRLAQTLIGASRYEALVLLAGYEKDREGLRQMLALLRQRFIRLATVRWRPGRCDEQLAAFQSRVTPRQAAAAAEAVGVAAERAGRNVGLALVQACMVEAVKRALSA